MEKRNLQILFSVIFLIATLVFVLYAYNQLQLNTESKKIIDANNTLFEELSSSIKDDLAPIKNLDSLKLEDSKKSELNSLLAGLPPQTENIKNQLKTGVNFPSINNYNLIVSKLNTVSEVSNNLSNILDIKTCFKEKYGSYSTTLNSIGSIQEEIATAGSFAESKEALEKLKAEYQKLISNGTDVETCLDDKFKDLKTSISDSNKTDKENIEKYQTEYLNPIIEIYASNDTAKIGEFIDQNSSVSVSLQLPSIFDNSLELSIADKVLGDSIDLQIARV